MKVSPAELNWKLEARKNMTSFVVLLLIWVTEGMNCYLKQDPWPTLLYKWKKFLFKLFSSSFLTVFVLHCEDRCLSNPYDTDLNLRSSFCHKLWRCLWRGNHLLWGVGRKFFGLIWYRRLITQRYQLLEWILLVYFSGPGEDGGWCVNTRRMRSDLFQGSCLFLSVSICFDLFYF